MIGDSTAMFVDSISYLFKLIAERQKNRFDKRWQERTATSSEEAFEQQQQAKRKMTLTCELVPPLVSIVTLLGITVNALHDSLQVLVLDKHREISEQRVPSIS